MKTTYIASALIAMALFASCKEETKTTEKEVVEEVKEVVKEDVEIKRLKMALEAKSDSKATGSVVFEESNGTVSTMAAIHGLSEGTHAIHIHEKADCSSADGKSAGGHWNPTAQPHGEWGAETGYHKGDIGNFEADENGNGVVNFKTNEWCIGCGDEKKDIVGKAIIVHQGTDDFTSQPSGDAGARVSCGGIIQ
ncbi:superoxide dismutase family protein [uncultured Dokdonia sp.]|uniref:superoxide dismutase family protein n=1 Tax=uncultured Dokdonia sp. TaxID=575653 RepID=UPI00261F698C|nr:superoxide dismutase family protein [uncultured Dokdonia sp.]